MLRAAALAGGTGSVKKAEALAWTFDCVCLMQSDIVGFTKLGARLTPEALCGMLHNLFSDFDEICDEVGVYKIETIGDAYLASTGCIPHSHASPQEDALRVARLAVELQEHCKHFQAPDGSFLQMRIGLVTGPAMGGVVGASMLRYHLFGPLTQEVTCYEQAAPPGKILCSSDFRDALLGLRSGGGGGGGGGGGMEGGDTGTADNSWSGVTASPRGGGGGSHGGYSFNDELDEEVRTGWMGVLSPCTGGVRGGFSWLACLLAFLRSPVHSHPCLPLPPTRTLSLFCADRCLLSLSWWRRPP